MNGFQGGLRLTGLLSMLALAGCASLPEGYQDPRDPWESYNRAVTKFNDKFDENVYRPVAEGYKKVTPTAVDTGVTNFFGNQRDAVSALNNLLQLKLDRAASDLSRVAFNTTFGLLGVFDLASEMDIPVYREDFGQTLGYWGLATGPYLVWPVLGPSDVRDSFGLVADWYSSPTRYLVSDDVQIGLGVLKGVDTRADLLGATDVLQQAALDPYTFVRDAYLEKRRSAVDDGQRAEGADDPFKDDPMLEEMFRSDPASPNG